MGWPLQEFAVTYLTGNINLLACPQKADPYITPHHLFISEGHSISRIPYFGEDDIEMLNPKVTFNFSKDNFIADGLKIFNFHPVHIALNFCLKVIA
jgi:hypothetical protein